MSNYILIDNVSRLEVSRMAAEGDITPIDNITFIEVDNSAIHVGGTYYLDPSNNIKNSGLPPKPHYYFDPLEEQWKPDISQLSVSARTSRDRALQLSDWTDTLSAKSRLGDSLYIQWQEYRQALRDITAQEGFPENIIWPEAPNQ